MAGDSVENNVENNIENNVENSVEEKSNAGPDTKDENRVRGG
jgi:hypothetical protein